jgi:hypothetical protein
MSFLKFFQADFPLKQFNSNVLLKNILLLKLIGILWERYGVFRGNVISKY